MPEFRYENETGKDVAQYIATMSRAYVTAAYWTDTGEPEQPPTETPESILMSASAVVACAEFYHSCADSNISLDDIDAEQCGHDLWLTRNGHGAGFWDRGLGDLGDKLATIAEEMGSAYLYDGDNGLMYFD